MAEWASLKPKQGLRRERLTLEGHFWPFVLGMLIARGSIMGLYPFGIAFGSALMLYGRKGTLMGLLGVAIGAGTLVLKDLFTALEILLILLVLSLIVPRLRGSKRESLYLGLVVTLVTGCVSLIAIGLSQRETSQVLEAVISSVVNGGLAVVIWYAWRCQGVLMSGNFTREQGIAWLAVLLGVVSGLQGIVI